MPAASSRLPVWLVRRRRQSLRQFEMMTHGTRYTYRFHRCRCTKCRAWEAARKRAQYRRRQKGRPVPPGETSAETTTPLSLSSTRARSDNERPDRPSDLAFCRRRDRIYNAFNASGIPASVTTRLQWRRLGSPADASTPPRSCPPLPRSQQWGRPYRKPSCPTAREPTG